MPKRAKERTASEVKTLAPHGQKTKLTQGQAEKLRTEYQAGVHPSDLAKRYKLSVPMVWKIIEGERYPSNPSSRWLATPNPMPPDRVKTIVEAYGRMMGETRIHHGERLSSAAVERLADRIGVKPRSVRDYMRDETVPEYRRPPGPVVKLLEELEWTVGIRRKKEEG